MKKIAEYVSNGHPDRICDQIVDNIMKEAIKKDKDALVGLEAAVHTNKVFIDGRIAAGKNQTVIDNKQIENIIKETYKNIGYSKKWYPSIEDLLIIQDVCIEQLSEDERNIRKYSDDQNIVNGYALNNIHTDYFPIEHYIVKKLGEKLWDYYIKEKPDNLGPDFKLMIQLDENSKSFDRITLSWWHDNKITYQKLRPLLFNKVNELLKEININNYTHIENSKFYLNGAGDFTQGGPNGDNGLSGKKLVIDFYGPSIPIGGGAIYGKDPHKIDVVGAKKAREFAIKLIKENNYYQVFTQLSYSPGEEVPFLIEAIAIDELGTKYSIDKDKYPPFDWFSINSNQYY